MQISLIDPKTVSDPEVLAMLMAFYSRSTTSIHNRLESLGENEAKIKESLKRYFIGYGHNSIADCASVSLFFEDISLLAAKALEATPLFNGQECSTRYLDFARRPIIDPFQTKESQAILARWIKLYDQLQFSVRAHLISLNPETEPTDVWKKAITAKTFDICRAFLPVGVTTCCAVHMGMRAFYEHITTCQSRPEQEIQQIADQTLSLLKTQFPSVFARPLDPETRAFRSHYIDQYSLHFKECSTIQQFKLTECISPEIFDFAELLSTRPRGVEVPPSLSSLGSVTIDYSLDYGSWRDIQRHRNTIYNNATPVSQTRKFYPEYIKYLPYNEKLQTLQTLDNLYGRIERIYEETRDLAHLQYLLPLGNTVNARLILTIPQLVYILDLRSSQAVHFTVRQLILNIWNTLRPKYPFLSRWIDDSPTAFNLKRGEQTIKELFYAKQ